MKKEEINKKPDSLRTRINKAKVLKHLKLSYGNVRLACENANVSPSQFYKWRQVDLEFEAKELDVHRRIEEFALASCVKKIEQENLSELIKLKRKSAKRINKKS